MARRYVIQHRSTGAFLGLVPSLTQETVNQQDGEPLHVTDLKDAASYPTTNYADLERETLGSFAGAYKVTPIEYSSIDGAPREIPLSGTAERPEDPQWSGPVY